MVCAYHTDKQAVAQCETCGAYICKDCMDKTQYLRKDFGVLCPDCYNNKIEEAREMYAEVAHKKMLTATISLICYIVGWIILSFSKGNIIVTLIGILAIGGYCAVAGWRFAANSIDEYDAKHGATYVVTDTGIHRDRGTFVKVIFFILGIVFGVFITPINIIRWYVSAAKAKKQVKYCDLMAISQQ